MTRTQTRSADVTTLLRTAIADLHSARDEMRRLVQELAPKKDASGQAAPRDIGEAMRPKTRLPNRQYRDLVKRIGDVARRHLPADAAVAVISRGDNDLLAHVGVHARHFPQNGKGQYIGHHPADSDAALKHLEAARTAGAAFLLIPGTALWWLDHYKDFAHHLQAQCRVVVRQPDACVIYALREHSGSHAAEPQSARAYRHMPRQLSEVLRRVLPARCTIAVISKGDDAWMRLVPTARAWHFPQDANGVYAGHYPVDSADAIEQLETLRQKGAEFFVVPALAFWWLSYYKAFGRHLEQHYRIVVRQSHLGLVFDLRRPQQTEVPA